MHGSDGRTSDLNFNDQIYAGGFFDRTKFELVDSIGNVFNRLFIFDAQNIHAASEYFGQTKEDSRLFHIFFFDWWNLRFTQRQDAHTVLK